MLKNFLANKAALRSLSQRSFGSSIKFEHKPLPYELSGLEPVISGHLMDYHYNKHHKTYVTNLNNLYQQQGEFLEKGDEKMAFRIAQNIKFNAGGNVNHTFFWESLAPIKEGGGARLDASSKLTQMLEKQWGGYD